VEESPEEHEKLRPERLEDGSNCWEREGLRLWDLGGQAGYERSLHRGEVALSQGTCEGGFSCKGVPGL